MRAMYANKEGRRAIISLLFVVAGLTILITLPARATMTTSIEADQTLLNVSEDVPPEVRPKAVLSISFACGPHDASVIMTTTDPKAPHTDALNELNIQVWLKGQWMDEPALQFHELLMLASTDLTIKKPNEAQMMMQAMMLGWMKFVADRAVVQLRLPHDQTVHVFRLAPDSEKAVTALDGYATCMQDLYSKNSG